MTREKIRVKEAIIVEGRYDKNTLSQIFDAVIIETSGFGIFSDSEKLELIKRLAEKRGVVILTDGDGAGFLIRNYLKGTISGENVKHAYIPDINGKERRKSAASKEGKLGVEGMKAEVLKEALRRSGASMDESQSSESERELTKADLYALGLSGTANSSEKRRALVKKLGLPERISVNAMLDVLNALYSYDEIKTL